MAIFTVGPNSSFTSIADAMLAAGPADTILLEPGYGNETATVTHNGMTISGNETSTGIVLQLATGIATFFLAGTAPITILDALDGNGIAGNDGDNQITVTDGADAVNGADSDFNKRCAKCMQSCASATTSINSTNSSPPKRATVSTVRLA